MIKASPRPWRVKESAITERPMIVDADGLIIAGVSLTSKGKKMPTQDNAELIVFAVNAVSTHRDQQEESSDGNN